MLPKRRAFCAVGCSQHVVVERPRITYLAKKEREHHECCARRCETKAAEERHTTSVSQSDEVSLMAARLHATKCHRPKTTLRGLGFESAAAIPELQPLTVADAIGLFYEVLDLFEHSYAINTKNKCRGK